MKRSLFVASLILSTLGMYLILTSYNGLTGNVISNLNPSDYSLIAFIGLILFLTGLLMMGEAESYNARRLKLREMLGEERYKHLGEDEIIYNRALRRYQQRQERDKALEEKARGNSDLIVRTDTFERAIKGYDPVKIQRAIDKLEAGIGRQKPVIGHGGRYKGMFEARVNDTARILYRREGRKVILENFTSDHDYEAMGAGAKPRK